MNEEIKKAALALLEGNKALKVIYAVADGNLFLELHHADLHARKIKCEVITITREGEKAPQDTTVPPVANSATMYDVDPKPIKPVEVPIEVPKDPDPDPDPKVPAETQVDEKKNE